VSVSALSTSTQNYLKALWSLQEWSSAPVTSTMVATSVGVRNSTASDAMKKLAEQGLVEHEPYGAIVLTDEGRSHALAMVRRHRLLETFLVSTLGYRWDQVHDEAEHLEHAVSDFLVDRIDETLGHPERDPHGDPIPRADGSIVIPSAATLASLPAGARARVERISDEDPRLLQFLADRGLGHGTLVELADGAPFSGALEVRILAQADGPDESGRADGGSFPLGAEAAAAVWATVLD
jgi:DtxR family Mn-dependent transcriptional regulator